MPARSSSACQRGRSPRRQTPRGCSDCRLPREVAQLAAWRLPLSTQGLETFWEGETEEVSQTAETKTRKMT